MNLDGSLALLLILTIAGWALVAALYAARGGRVSRTAVFGLAVLHALAFLWIAAELCFPVLHSVVERFHPPSLLVVLDGDSPWAAKDSGELRPSAQGVRDSLRRHYQALGFQMREREFRDPLPVHLWDPTETANLKGVFFLSDFRGPAAMPPLPPVPGFAVLPPLPDSGAALPESLVIAGDGEGALEVSAAWRDLGKSGGGEWTLLRKGKPMASYSVHDSAAAAPWAMRRAAWPWPKGLARPLAADTADWSAVLGTAKGGSGAAVSIRWRLPESEPLCAFLAPLRSLDERAALDAVRASGRCRVEVLHEAAWRKAGTSPRHVLWARRENPRTPSASAVSPVDSDSFSAARITYALPQDPGLIPAEGEAGVTADAEWPGSLPAGWLRVRDAAPRLHGFPDSAFGESVRARGDGKAVVLTGWHRGEGRVRLALPPLWESRFRRDADPGKVALQEALILAALELAMARQGLAGMPSEGEAREARRPGFDREAAEHWAGLSGGAVVDWNRQPSAVSWPGFEASERRDPGTVAWPWAADPRVYAALVALFAALWIGRRFARLD